MKIFGGEPAAIVGSIQAVLIVAVSFGWLEGVGLSNQDDVMLVVAVLSGVAALVLAYSTTETLLAPAIELFKALAAVATIYGYNLTVEQTGAIVAAITMVLSLWQRTQVSPDPNPSFSLTSYKEVRGTPTTTTLP